MEDSNQPFWKEKFLAGLPILLGEKVRNKIKDTFTTKTIPYDQLTYGELVSFTQKEGLKICQDLKLQKHLKWEMKRTRQELGSFCHQFDLSTKKPSCSGNCSKPKHYSGHKSPYKHSSHKYRKQFNPKSEQTYYKKPYKKFTKPHKPFPNKSKPKFNLTKITCYKCNQKGHTSRFCKINTKLHELQIDDDTINQIQNLYIEAIDMDPSPSDTSEEEFQLDEIATSSATSDTSTNSKQISVLNQDQEFILEAIKRLDDPQLQKTYLDRLLKDFNKTEHPPSNPPNRSVLPSTSTNTYDLTKILNRKKSKITVTLPELHSEIKTLKSELQTLKQAQEKDSAILQHLLSKIENQSDTESEPEDPTLESHALPHALTNIEHVPDDFLNVLTQISSKKYLIRITLVFSDDFKLDTIALFDTGADLNCIKEGVVPKQFLQPTSEKLSAANNSKLHIAGKTQAFVFNTGISLKTFFVVTKDINHTIILGTPFIDMLTPYKARHDCITSNINNIKLVFPFLEKSKTRNLNLIKACSIHTYHINALIHGKQFQLHDLQNQVSFCRIDKQLQNSTLQNKITVLQSKIEQQICSDLPNAFWKRKQHIVDLPYEDTFSEKLIPTKARPIQMNAELEQHCRLEIQDLESKGLIQKSRSPWSCAAFYVNKNSEIERGTPRLVINYKPLNSALKWIRYPIPNKKDLLQKLHYAFIFSKFDMKSGFWQIQIDPKDRYKTAFTVPFGQYEWNVMPFGLKNAPSEFQRIMNDIFNAHSTFCIVYIDDVFIFSHSIDQHFKHLHIFFHTAKQNGLVISKSKISLFQTRVRFLGHYI